MMRSSILSYVHMFMFETNAFAEKWHQALSLFYFILFTQDWGPGPLNTHTCICTYLYVKNRSSQHEFWVRITSFQLLFRVLTKTATAIWWTCPRLTGTDDWKTAWTYFFFFFFSSFILCEHLSTLIWSFWHSLFLKKKNLLNSLFSNTENKQCFI